MNNKTCDYCNRTTVPDDWKWLNEEFICGNVEYFCFCSSWDSWSRDINFCPKCGRKCVKRESNNDKSN